MILSPPFRVDIIPRGSSSINFILVNIDRPPSADCVPINVSNTPTDHAPADGLLVDGVHTSFVNQLANGTDGNGLADGSSSNIIDTSFADRIVDRHSIDTT
jgi:hypothetical protein